MDTLLLSLIVIISLFILFMILYSFISIFLLQKKNKDVVTDLVNTDLNLKDLCTQVTANKNDIAKLKSKDK